MTDEKPADEREPELPSGDLGGIGERSGSVYEGEDGLAGEPHMPIEEPPPDDRA